MSEREKKLTKAQMVTLQTNETVSISPGEGRYKCSIKKSTFDVLVRRGFYAVDQSIGKTLIYSRTDSAKSLTSKANLNQ
jgi:hypothetical protein